MIIPFWSSDPTILFKREYILDIWPNPNMVFEEKMNAISRLAILITILGYILTRNFNLIFIGLLTLAFLFWIYRVQKEKLTQQMISESFTVNASVTGDSPAVVASNADTITNPVTLDQVLRTEFKEGTKKNPFSNVLLTEITDDPNRKAAPPSFNVDVSEDITRNVKKSVQMMNPGIKGTNKQLYGDLWQNFELDQSNRLFYSTANTRVESDQSAFAKFLYGDMPSAKGSTMEDNLQREKDNYRYILY
jgi:hypothetical protein